MPDSFHMFGPKENVEAVRHFIGTAGGWGGLPEAEAFYLNVDPGLPIGEYLEANDLNANSYNDVTAMPNADGTITLNFGGCEDGRGNCIPITQGWNYAIRLYQPRAEILDGSWTFPVFQPVN